MVRLTLREGRIARHMREDIADPALLAQLRVAEGDLRAAWRSGARAELPAAMEKVTDLAKKIYPLKRWPRLRENWEIIVVALAVAMAFRAYFLQPFRIPTGSMQPSLYGVTFAAPAENKAWASFPLKYVDWALFGESPVEIRAFADGQIVQVLKEHFCPGEFHGPLVLGQSGGQSLALKSLDANYSAYLYSIAGYQVVIPIPAEFTRHFNVGDQVRRGQLLATGKMRAGDHLFVNRMAYNFWRPARGDVVVFSTAGIDYPGVRRDTFYIKRLVGLAGEEVGVQPPYLVVNNQPVTNGYAFQRLLNAPGYKGYALARYVSEKEKPILVTPEDRIKVGGAEFLPFGDNTDHSLDGRYWGTVNRDHLVGPALFVYWPFTKRWGLIR